RYLAIQIARDGEGASKLIETEVVGARTLADARLIAKSVVSSSLVKSAFFGEDANWGRIICAIGNSGGHFEPGYVCIHLESAAGQVAVMRDGAGLAFDEELAAAVLKEKEIKVLVSLFDGDYSAKAWGCDLTYEYVRINGSYRS
ncbi:MAG: bifunctional ornithine acetyltransferase/N-acetylglutamate synthase, partial [Clostridiales bacterium]|nr:bifunctional ornithine acetyltransferase/N-acetylglutamate synthase [Clostridiales bacterium]